MVTSNGVHKIMHNSDFFFALGQDNISRKTLAKLHHISVFFSGKSATVLAMWNYQKLSSFGSAESFFCRVLGLVGNIFSIIVLIQRYIFLNIVIWHDWL